MLVGHLTLPVSTPVLPAPQRIENPEPVTRSVVLSPLQAPSGAAAGAPLKNPDPLQPEARQQNQRGVISPTPNGDDAPVNAAEANESSGEQAITGAEQKESGKETEQDRSDNADTPSKAPSVETGPTDEERAEIQALAARDREVRAHEQAHASVGGSLAGSANFSYDSGPDGRQYAVSGEVSIDVSPVPNNPEATIRKAQQIRRAAQAPADPSPQDRQVAAQAIQMEIQARLDLSEQRQQAFNSDERSSAAIDMYEKLTRIGRSQDLFPDLENVIDARA